MPLSRRMILKYCNRTSTLSKVYQVHRFVLVLLFFCFSDLIQGQDRHPENKEKSFLFQIVANKVNGVDVDK